MHVDIFRDKTNLLKVRKCEGEGVYMRFSGDKTNEIFYLGSIPHGVKVEQAMDFIFDDLCKLEEGLAVFYRPTNKLEIFYGGVMTFYGIQTIYKLFTDYLIDCMQVILLATHKQVDLWEVQEGGVAVIVLFLIHMCVIVT